MPENNPGGSTRTPLEMLRGVTRRVATAERLEVVLQSIATALVDQAEAANARIFLALTDDQCPVCRRDAAGASAAPVSGRALHCVASAGFAVEERLPHRIPFDSPLPPAVQWRRRDPVLIDDPDEFQQYAIDPSVLRVWREMGIQSAAGFPLDFRGEQLGSVGFLARRRITAEEFDLLGIFADQASLAIRNAQLYRENEEFRRRLEMENAYLHEVIAEERGFDGIVGESPAFRAVLRKVEQVAPVETTVLLTGETGTGKELIARALHQRSPRSERPFIRINCGAIPQGVVESELFGHEKGAFTGALQRRIGRFELADRGPSSWTRWASSPSTPRSSCFACSRSRSSSGSGAPGRNGWTCGWWRRPTATSIRRSRQGGSAPICSTGSTSFRSGSLRSGSALATAAYRRSSPIYFAEGLRDHLLIEHGLVDDNVHFQDTARLVERLIQLGKSFEVMYYPSEPHTVQTEASRLDQSRRAIRFFDRYLRGAGPPESR